MNDTGEFMSLGKFLLDPKPFASGGMGRIYKALDPDLDRVVAVKTIHEELSSDEKYRARFKREAKILAQIGQNEGVVSILDVGYGETLWLAMPMLNGETYAEHVGKLSLESVVKFALTVASTLEFAHTYKDRHGNPCGIIHCDIKPSNIFMENGRPVIIDWGLGFSNDAKEGDPLAMTKVRSAHGTAPYTSPEQTRGFPEFSSDVYSFGCTLYEMITGEIPFKAKSPAGCANKHLNDERPNAMKLRPECKPWLALLVRRCMAIECEDRPTLKNVLKTLRSGKSRMGQSLKSIAIHESIELGEDLRLNILGDFVIHDFDSNKVYDYIIVDQSKIEEIKIGPVKKIICLTDAYSNYESLSKIAKHENVEMIFSLSYENVLKAVK